MSYISLEDLKKFSPEDLKMRWTMALFPYDAALCGSCMTAHHKSYRAGCKEHQEFQDLVTKSFEFYGDNAIISNLDAHIEETYALRIFFKGLYSNNPKEIETTLVETTLENQNESRRLPVMQSTIL